MKVNLRKIGAIVAGATILASSVAIAGLWFDNTELVNANGAPQAKVVVGEGAAASDGVAAANIAAKLASEAFKSETFTAQVAGEGKCDFTGGAPSGGSCAISNEQVKLEVTVPGLTAAGTFTMETLVSEMGDRTLQDRGLIERTSFSGSYSGLSNYSLTNSETSTEAHPFTNGDTALSLAQSEQGLFRIDSSNFDAFKDVTLQDTDAGKTYTEAQAVFVRTENQYRDASDTVDGKLRNFIYQVKFKQDNYGIPVCTRSDNSSWRTCATTSTDYTGNHKVRIKFLGSDWVITELADPATAIANETLLVTGGRVTLAKESVSGIVNVGETLSAGAYTIRLDDIKSGSTASEQGAIVSLLDSTGSVLKQQVISPGATVTMTTASTGEKILVRVFKTAPGYTFGAKWADMAIISNELILRNNDIPEVNGDKTTNTNWRSVLTWKNRDVGTNSNESDHLRSIILYYDGSTDFISKGSGLNVINTPTPWKFLFKGLNLDKSSANDYDTFSLSASDGTFTYTPISTTATSREANTTSYLKIKSATSGAFSTSAGTGSELVVLFDAGTSRDTLLNASGDSGFSSALVPGSVLLRMDNGAYVHAGQSNSTTALAIRYLAAGSSGSAASGGAVVLGYGISNGTAITSPFESIGTGLANFSVAGQGTVAVASSAYLIMVSEDAGEGIASQKPDAFAFAYNLSSKSLNKDMGRYSKDKILYAPASNFSALASTPDTRFTLESRDGKPTTKELGYVTERGSIVTDLSDSSAAVKVAKKPAHVVFALSSSESATSEPSKRQYTLSEGQEVELEGTGGVKVKALDITELVGACSIGAGAAPACKVDTSGQSAVIMPANKASVDAVTPFGYDSYAPLVWLDRDAADTGVVVSVGGPVVNKVTRSILTGSDVEFTPGTVVVKEVSPGKIVVAGTDAVDTLEAAKQFIAKLKRQ